MAHKEQREFCEWARDNYPQYFNNKIVIDVGSRNINGDNRYLFTDCTYQGIDLSEGPNVDLVGKAHEVLPNYTADVVISTEALEHDKHYKETLAAMYRSLNAGGLLLITAGGVGRPEHGTPDFSPDASPDTNDYYRNISNEDFSEILKPAMFKTYFIDQHEKEKDFHFMGIKSL